MQTVIISSDVTTVFHMISFEQYTSTAEPHSNVVQTFSESTDAVEELTSIDCIMLTAYVVL